MEARTRSKWPVLLDGPHQLGLTSRSKEPQAQHLNNYSKAEKAGNSILSQKLQKELNPYWLVDFSAHVVHLGSWSLDM